MPSPIEAMEMMNQLNLEYGKEPSAKARSTDNDRDANPEKSEKFRKNVEDAITEREAQKNLRKIESNKAKHEVSQMAEQHRADTAKANQYTKNFSGNTRGGGGGGGGMGGNKLSNRDLTRAYKKGGKVTASSRADGCCQKGKTKGRMV